MEYANRGEGMQADKQRYLSLDQIAEHVEAAENSHIPVVQA